MSLSFAIRRRSRSYDATNYLNFELKYTIIYTSDPLCLFLDINGRNNPW